MRTKSIFISSVIFILVTTFFLAIINFGTAKDEKGEIAKEKIIEIANKEMVKLGYDGESMEITSIKKYGLNWGMVISRYATPPFWAENLEIKNKLKGKGFWVISYGHKELVLGGVLCVFVDSDTGEVITFFGGK